jgi:hypothetical protein
MAVWRQPVGRLTEGRLSTKVAVRAASYRGALSLSRVVAGRLTYVTVERCAKRACGAVTDTFGDLSKTDVTASKQILRDGHAPREQVFHWRQAHDTREAAGPRYA